MRRRRPSALYTVLDDEQLLGGVDLADHSDPLTGRPRRAPVEEWDEWSPDPEAGPDDDRSHQWEGDEAIDERRHEPQDDEALAARPPGEGEPAGGRESSFDRGGRGGVGAGSRRRRWTALGFVGGLVVVLLVAREIGAAVETAGLRPNRRQAITAPAGAPPAPTRPFPRGGAPAAAGPSGGGAPPVVVSPSAGDAGAQPGRRLPVRPAGETTSGARRPDPPQPPRTPVRGPVAAAVRAPVPGAVRLVAPAGGPATPGRGTRPPGPRPSRPTGRTRLGEVHRSTSTAPSRSPVEEFGFER